MSLVNLKESDIINFIDEFPNSISLHQQYIYNIKNQKNINSCAIMALTSLIEYLRQIDGKEFIPLSDNYIFYNCIQTLDNDGLTSGRTNSKSISNISGFKTCSVIKTILTKGACYQKRWRTVFDANIKPSNQIILESLSNIKETEIEVIDINLNCIKYVLGYCGRPIVANVKFTDGCKCITSDDEDKFNHSVLFVGYDDEKQIIIYQNSYGEKWGNNGFSVLPYSYLSYINSLYSMTESCIKAFFNFDIQLNVIEKL